MTLTVPSPRESVSLPAKRLVDSPRPTLRVLPAAQKHPPRAPFVAVILVLLIAGLGSLLLLNTLLAQGSFTVRDLSVQVSSLQDREQALQQRVATLDAPRRLARQAAALGMVPVVNPAFLRVRDGRVLGLPIVATGPANTNDRSVNGPAVDSSADPPSQQGGGQGPGPTSDKGGAVARDNTSDNTKVDPNQDKGATGDHKGR